MYELNSNERERAILIGVNLQHGSRWLAEDHIEELAQLADTAGAEVIGKIIQDKNRVDAAYFIGKGKAQDISNLAQENQADVLIFDDDLSPAQVKNLERLTKKKILDRSGLILDIFARRAKTREARTQVELAQLNYLLPRLTRQWTHLSRQVGGIGTRGPGETQLEVDRRIIGKRISKLTRDLEKIKGQRKVRRQGRKDVFKVALVGYTNVGKSTLLNVLTDSEVFVENRLFATLDATVRHMASDSPNPILLIDTVGFIRKLPHHLVASFKSTLEEANEADMLLHVVDISHPGFEEQIAVVKDVLQQLHIANKPTITVFNKVDQLEQKGLISRLREKYENSIFVSAVKGLFVQDLKAEIIRMSKEVVVETELILPIQYAWISSKLYEYAEVSDIDYGDHEVRMHLKIPPDRLHAVETLLKNEIDGQYNYKCLQNPGVSSVKEMR